MDNVISFKSSALKKAAVLIFVITLIIICFPDFFYLRKWRNQFEKAKTYAAIDRDKSASRSYDRIVGKYAERASKDEQYER